MSQPALILQHKDMRTVTAAGPASGDGQLVQLAAPGGAIAVVQMLAGGGLPGLRSHERHNPVNGGLGSRG